LRKVSDFSETFVLEVHPKSAFIALYSASYTDNLSWISYIVSIIDKRLIYISVLLRYVSDFYAASRGDFSIKRRDPAPIKVPFSLRRINIQFSCHAIHVLHIPSRRSNMPVKNILVTGATGKQGGALIRGLLSNPKPAFHIYALTRNPSSPSAKALASNPSITVVEGEPRNPLSIFKHIAQPLHGVFSVTVPNPFKSGQFEEAQAIPLIDASVNHGVKQFIFTSADRGGPGKADDDPTPVPHFITKYNVEKHLKSTNMQWTILRPVAFYENLTPDFLGKSFATMWKQMGDVKLGLVGTTDIGIVAAKAFSHPEDYANKVVNLVGDQLTFAEGEKIFRDALGFEMPATSGFVTTGLKWAIHDLGAMFKWFGRGGYAWDMSSVRREEKLMDFKTWLQTEGKFER
jgi:uncharacterized protein YbjT (DUF2867 family)